MYPLPTLQWYHNLAIFTPCRFMSSVSAPHLPSVTTILQSLHLAGLWAMYPLHTLQRYHNLAIFTPCRLMNNVSALLQCSTIIIQYLHLAGLWAMCPLHTIQRYHNCGLLCYNPQVLYTVLYSMYHTWISKYEYYESINPKVFFRMIYTVYMYDEYVLVFINNTRQWVRQLNSN